MQITTIIFVKIYPVNFVVGDASPVRNRTLATSITPLIVV